MKNNLNFRTIGLAALCALAVSCGSKGGDPTPGGGGPLVSQIDIQSSNDYGSYTSNAIFSYDNQRRVVEVESSHSASGEDPWSGTTTYTYGTDNSITITDPDGQLVGILDAMGRVSLITYFDDTNVTVTYDANGYMQKVSTSGAVVLGPASFTWSGGNITQTQDAPTNNFINTITYTDKTYKGNLYLEYFTYVISSVGEIEMNFGDFGLLGYCGKPCANLPLKVTMLDREIDYSYTFNSDGTVKTITENDSDANSTTVTTFSYK